MPQRSILRLFSWSFMWRAFTMTIRHPEDLIRVPFGTNYRTLVYERRKREWMRVKEGFRESPKTICGSKIYLNPDDLSPVGVSIGTTGWLNLPLTSLALNLAKPGMKVIDVGANIGYYTVLFASRVGTSGLVVSFEPEPLNCSYLRRSVDANSFRNVVVKEIAVSDRDGETLLHLSPSSEPQEHSTHFERQGPSINVQCTSLNSVFDSLGRARIDILKIHVSGAEMTVLEGGLDMIEKSHPTIITVYGRVAWKETPDLLKRLSESYDFYEVVPRPWLLRRISQIEILAREWVELCLRPKSPGFLDN